MRLIPNTPAIIHLALFRSSGAWRLAATTSALLAVACIACGTGEPQTAVPLGADAGETVLSYSAETLDVTGPRHIDLETVQEFGDPRGRGMLYIPLYLDVDEDGSVFIADNGNKNVTAFSATGELLGSFSRRGQGPGEIEQARGIAVQGDKVYVIADWNRLVVWTREGRYLRDAHFPSSASFMGLAATRDGTLVSRYFRVARGSESADETVIAGFADNGDETLHTRREVALLRMRTEPGAAPIPQALPVYAVSRTGRIYYSGAAEYEIEAADVDGSRLWRLRAAIDAPGVTDDDIERALRARRPGFEISRESVDWPETFPTLLFLRVDGHGHLYVYRWVRNDPTALPLPVDVFTPAGEHLFSGTIDRKQWLLGRGDLVYGFEESPSAGGVVAVAYRIREPFAP